MNIIIFGPPGIGKGSISIMIKEKYGIPHISTGNILREEILREGTDSKIKKYIEKGLLVPDEEVMRIVEKRLRREDCKKGFILDGFPRTMEQAKFLKNKGIKIDIVINLIAEPDVIISRLSGRLICPKCDSIYHMKNMPPKKDGICDKCGAKLIQRTDDKPDVIKKRIKTYKKQTEGIIVYYGNEKLLVNVQADGTLDKIFNNIVKDIRK